MEYYLYSTICGGNHLKAEIMDQKFPLKKKCHATRTMPGGFLTSMEIRMNFLSSVQTYCIYRRQSKKKTLSVHTVLFFPPRSTFRASHSNDEFPVPRV